MLLVPFNRREAGRGAFGIDRIDLLRFGVIDQQGRIAADAVHRLVNDTEHGLARHDGVKGVAALFQNALSRARRFSFHRRDCEVPAAHDRTHCPGRSLIF